MLYRCKNAFTTLMPNFCQPVFKFLLHRMHRLCPGRLQNQILLLMQGSSQPVEHRVQPAIDNLLILMEGKVC